MRILESYNAQIDVICVPDMKYMKMTTLIANDLSEVKDYIK